MTGNERNASETYECDVLVAGSGCSGMSAAITARYRGLDVLIVEKEPRFGGTTARSGGWLWIPGTSLAKAYGIAETAEQARTYLRHEAGNNFDAARVDAFLSAGPEAVDFFTTKTALRFDMPLVFPGLPRRGARRHAGRPLDGDAPVRRPRARRPDQDARHAAARADRVRHDARIRQGDHPFHARDEVADLGGLRRKAPVAAFDGRAALRPRHDPDQRQCARRAPGKIRAGSEDSDVAVLAGARADGRERHRHRRDRCARGTRRPRPRATRRRARLRRFPARCRAAQKNVSACADRERAFFARPDRQHRRRPAACGKRRRTCRGPPAECGRLGAGVAHHAQGRLEGRDAAFHRPRQTRRDRGDARRQALCQ